MIAFLTLTGGRKMMNMAKLGTVIQSKTGQAKSGNPLKQRAGDLMRYTLCVFQDKARRNGSRNSFARKGGFDLSPISGRPLGRPLSAGQPPRSGYGPSNTMIPRSRL